MARDARRRALRRLRAGRVNTTGFAHLWPLDPSIVFLNHGSFGACPTEVLRYQADLRAEMEAEPVRFLSRELDGRLDVARAALGHFLGADPDDLAFLPNATSRLNAVPATAGVQPRR